MGSRDTTPAPDGTIWFCGQRNGTLGRLDPRDGSYKLVDLGKGAAPHGVIIGPDGAPWVTEGGQNAIARVDPGDHKVTLFRLPEKEAYANLNTAVFDKSGIYWFTGQSGIYGRLDPKSGDMTVFKSPRGRGTYGMTITPKGDIWYASLAGNHIARIDPATGNATVVEPPTPNQGARRVWSDSKGRIWVSEWNSGNVSVHDPADGSWKAWKLPGSNPAHLCRLCRRQGQGLAHRFRRQRDRALRSRDGKVQRVPERQIGRQCAPARRPARRNLGRRIRQRPPRRDPDGRACVRLFAVLLLLPVLAARFRRRGGRRRAGVHALPRLPQPRSGRARPARPQSRWPDRTRRRRRRGFRLFAGAAQGARRGSALGRKTPRNLPRRSRRNVSGTVDVDARDRGRGRAAGAGAVSRRSRPRANG